LEKMGPSHLRLASTKCKRAMMILRKGAPQLKYEESLFEEKCHTQEILENKEDTKQLHLSQN